MNTTNFATDINDLALDLNDLEVDGLEIVGDTAGKGVEQLTTGHGITEIGASWDPWAACCSCCIPCCCCVG